MKWKTLFPMLLWLATPIAVTPATSIPPLINYQGQLLSAAGENLPTADYELRFSVYDAAQGGNLVWGPQVFNGQSGPGYGPKIPVVQGYFNVMLGPVDTSLPGRPLSEAFNGDTRYIEVKVGDNQPILPRQQILTAPYAFNASKLVGQDWSALFGTNDPLNGKIHGSRIQTETITSAQIADGTINTERLKDGAISTAKIGDAQVTQAKLADGSILDRHISSVSRLNLSGSLLVGASLSTNGNFGIGTTAPLYALDVRRASPNEDWLAGFRSGPSFVHLAHGAGEGVEIRTESTAPDRRLLEIQSYTGTTVFRVRNDGNIGIGTTSPQAKLDVAGTLQIAAMAQQSFGKNGYIQIGELIIQWGEEDAFHDAVYATTKTTVTFPKPFPNEVFQIIPGIRVQPNTSNISTAVAVESVSRTQAVLMWHEMVGPYTQTLRASYIAIGR